MPQPTTICVLKGRALKSELEGALITPSAGLESNVMFSSSQGHEAYLPVYQSAAQSAGGNSAFTPTVTEDGTISFFVEATAPAELAKQAGAASQAPASPSFALVLNASGEGRRFPLEATSEGGAIQRLRTRFSGDDLKQVRAALFDVNPNVAIEVTQTLKLAVQQTRNFVDANWSNATIRQGLLELFQIPFNTAATYYQMACGGDPDFPNQYLVMRCVYKAQTPAPPLPGFVQWQVNWKNRAYNYYQDNQDRERVFYLPDRFEFAEGPTGAPSVSLLQFTLPEGNATVERTRATFRLFGKPVVDLERIQNAVEALRGSLGKTPQMVPLEDAHGVRMTFTQCLPNSMATGSTAALQEHAQINLAAGLRNELDLNFAQFRALWAAIFSADRENPLFRGWVDVILSDGRYKERVDFDGRLPRERETQFFDDILDTTTESTYPANFQVQTFPSIFASGDAAVQELDVIFAGGKALALDAGNLSASVQLERSIRDIVLGNQRPDEYPYTLKVIRQDGTISCCPGVARSDTPRVWIGVDQVEQCTGKCS